MVFNDHRAAVLRYARRLTSGDDDWAEDVVQETFLRAWQLRISTTPEHTSIRGWLMRVAHNLVMDGYRSARMRYRVLPLDETYDDVAVPELTDQILAEHMVSQALRRIPEPHRRALEVTFLRDLTAVQAARVLNVPVGTVKSRVFYGLRMLRSIMQPDTPASA
jgi:RNA polymerase sigma-70 factor (ECF subfamily)